MSSRPNSSQQTKNMFSSLPSASKIYVSSTKPRQKHVPCVKRKRKKSASENNIVESNIDETLISLDDKSESSIEIQLIKNESVIESDQNPSGIEFKYDSADKNSEIPSFASDDTQCNGKYMCVTIENDGSLSTENDILYPNCLELSLNHSEASETNDANLRDIDHATSSHGENAIVSNLAPEFSELIISDIDLIKSVTEETDLQEENLALPDLTPEDYASKIPVSDIINCDTVKADLLKENLVPSNFSPEHFESEITPADIKSLVVDETTLRQSTVAANMFESSSDINNSDIRAKESDSVNYPCDALSENSVHVSDDKTSIVLTCEKKLVNEAISKCICNNKYIDKVVDAETQTNIVNSSLIDSVEAKKDEPTDFENFSLENNNFEDKENSNISYCADDTVLYDHSEQNSCTESGQFELQTKISNVSPSKDFVKQKDQSISLNYEANCDMSNVILKHSDIIYGLKSQQTFNLKHSMSLPVNLHTLDDEKISEINIGSNITLSSDKATLTSDLLYLKDSVKYLDQKENEDNKFPELKSISVASGEDVPHVNILPPLAMIKARMRNYVFGCRGLKGSLLGNDELSRLFPQNKISVFVGTWNMNCHDSPENIDDFLLPLETDTLPDIYAIGVQESMPSKSEWELLLQTTLGPSHVLFTSSSLGALHLVIFLRRDLIWFCSVPEEANIATRVGSMVKTKGAVAVCFMLFGTSFLFVNSHLTAHEPNLVDRISDYEKICSGLDLPRTIPLKSGYHDKDVTSRFDCVFWCGDLNFRIVCGRLDVLRLIKEKFHSKHQSCNVLLKHDQLQNAIKEGAAFLGFKEGVINFNPSYKFDIGTNDFDSTKLRVPSYTDRILYRSKDSSSVSCINYNCVPELVTSDHKPVYAIFNVTVKPGRDNVPLAAGIFKRDVYLEAIRRRAKVVEVNWNQKQSTICSIM